jgi:hypothetical protein
MRHLCGTSITMTVQGNQCRSGVRQYLRLGAVVVLIGLSASTRALQSGVGAAAGAKKSASRTPQAGTKKAADPNLAKLEEDLKDPELVKEFGQLIEKVQKGISYPAVRNQSGILARLPESTVFYAAFPNPGESAHQGAQIFREELERSAQLKAFLTKNKLDAVEPQIESGIEKFYEFSQFLGDEIVIAGRLRDEKPTGVVIAEVRKPGLREFLEKLNQEVFTRPGDRLRILDSQQLAAAGDDGARQAPVILIRPDYIAMGLSVDAVREFNSQIDRSGPGLTASPWGRKLAESYQGGVNTVLGVDLHKLIGLIPAAQKDRANLEKTGFTDASYLVLQSTVSATGSTGRFELGFQHPRRGIASWLATPAPMGGLDFVSGHAALATDMILKSPAQIFDDLREMLGDSAFASLPQMEAQLHVNLKQDVLAKLSGEMALEMPWPLVNVPGTTVSAFSGASSAPAKPGSFKVILRVADPAGLERTLARLLAASPAQSGQREEDGVTVNTLRFPGAAAPAEINYFFLDGYLIIASDRAAAREALQAHRGGESLAKSGKLRGALASGQGASVVVYQDAGRMLSAMMAQLPPELQQVVSAAGGISSSPSVLAISADQRAFHGVTTSNNSDNVAAMLVVAAIALPNLIKSQQTAKESAAVVNPDLASAPRATADESAAVANVRTLNTAEITYASSYPDKGFSPSLAELGPGNDGTCAANDPSADHACLLDGTLANASCTAGQWCEKSGYRFAIRGTCLQGHCMRYVVTATPAHANAGARSFCSTDDAVIRSHAGTPLAAALTAAECKMWRPIQ